MPRKIRQLKQDLRKAGFGEIKGGGKGSHTRWIHPNLPTTTLTIPGHDGDDADRYLEKQVKDALNELKEPGDRDPGG